MMLQTLPSNTDLEKIQEVMEQDGACIIENVLLPSDLEQLGGELSPYIESSNLGLDEFTGYQTKRIGALFSRSPKCRELAIHKNILKVANRFLKPYCDKIQLHLSQAIAIFSGQKAQNLHRDRYVWGPYLGKEIEPQLNTIWALTDFTQDNGATHVVPKSHLWSFDRHASRSQSIQATMSKGSVLLYSGTIIHGGGENRSSEPRIGINITYCLGWLRTEENMSLSCPPEIARDFPQEITDLLGYSMGNYALGYYSPTKTVEGLPDTLAPEHALGIPFEKWSLTSASEIDEIKNRND